MKFYALIDGAFSQGTIDQETWEFLWIKYPRIPTFYCLPKVHKDLLMPPGRPIVSGNGAITEILSLYLDRHLRPFVIGLPSYVHDTIHLLQSLEGLHISPHTFLVAIDIEALYSSLYIALSLTIWD